MQLPAKQTRATEQLTPFALNGAKQTRVAAQASHLLSCGATYGRTGGRSYGWTSDVITKLKFLAFTSYQILLAMGLCARGAPL